MFAETPSLNGEKKTARLSRIVRSLEHLPTTRASDESSSPRAAGCNLGGRAAVSELSPARMLCAMFQPSAFWPADFCALLPASMRDTRWCCCGCAKERERSAGPKFVPISPCARILSIWNHRRRSVSHSELRNETGQQIMTLRQLLSRMSSRSFGNFGSFSPFVKVGLKFNDMLACTFVFFFFPQNF